MTYLTVFTSYESFKGFLVVAFTEQNVYVLVCTKCLFYSDAKNGWKDFSKFSGFLQNIDYQFTRERRMLLAVLPRGRF
jgi:hypothetical protein